MLNEVTSIAVLMAKLTLRCFIRVRLTVLMQIDFSLLGSE